MKRFALPLVLALALGTLLAAAPAHAAFIEMSGKVNLIRVQDTGQLFGPPGDVIDADVIFTLTTQAGKAFGFQLRPGTNELARDGMLDLLRDAFQNNWTVVINCTVDPGHNNSLCSRVWIVKP
jgi:hypothetical protein